MKKLRRNRKLDAFTLIEVLAVIAIIGLLVGLLFPAIKGALQKAEIAQAQNDIKNIQTALSQFYTDYGKWPNGNGGTADFSYGAFGSGNYAPAYPNQSVRSGYCENHWLMETLQANPDNLAESAVDNGVPAPRGNGSANNSPANLVNTRHTVYLNIPAKSLQPSTDGTGGLDFVDPWKNPYQITVDTTYDNICSNDTYSGTALTPFGLGKAGYVTNTTMVVWSFGPLGPYVPHTAKDWITSW
jgi:prepilin-type N-terminal cleavage/methylation domain-containing protein